MKKQQSTFEYRLAEATPFEDQRGREIVLPPNTRLVYGGYSPEGLGQFTVAAGKEHGRGDVEADAPLDVADADGNDVIATERHGCDRHSQVLRFAQGATVLRRNHHS